jgi:prepilin-type N-terminal cleavage/methylation domain-containing protein
MKYRRVRKSEQRNPRRRPFRPGFSLVELIVVMAILVLMAGVAVPRFAGTLARRRVEFAAARVVSDLRLAQREARLASQLGTASFDVAADTYSLLSVTDLDHPTEYKVRLADQPYEVNLISVDLGGDAQIQYDGYGVPDSGGTIILAVRGQRITITLDAVSGRASTQYTQVAYQDASEVPSEPTP